MSEITPNNLPKLLINAQNHLKQGNFKEAADILLECFLAEPHNEQIFNSLTTVIKLHNQTQYSEYAFEKILMIDPKNIYSLQNLSIILINKKEYPKAQKLLDEILNQHPDNIEALSILSGLELRTSEYTRAISTCNKILKQKNTEKLNPNLLATVYETLALALFFERNLEEAIKSYELSLKLVSTPNARKNFANILLLAGNLEDGFREYESRKEVKEFSGLYEFHANGKHIWQGELFPGKTLLVHHEQGFGDNIYCARYLPEVKKRGGTVIFSAPKSLLPLYKDLDGVDVLSEELLKSEDNPQYDLVVPSLSLPHILGITLKTIPHSGKYITADKNLAEVWHGKILNIDNANDNFRVGLVWATGNCCGQGHKKTFRLADLHLLADIDSVSYYSLQIGPASEETQNLPANMRHMRLFDLTEDIHNFADTAALIANIDLVITADTSVAHLAGAMGKPVWTLLHYTSGWFWLTQRSDTPLYDSMRLFRQSSPGDWAGVMRQVEKNLRNCCNRRFFLP